MNHMKSLAFDMKRGTCIQKTKNEKTKSKFPSAFHHHHHQWMGNIATRLKLTNDDDDNNNNGNDA